MDIFLALNLVSVIMFLYVSFLFLFLYLEHMEVMDEEVSSTYEPTVSVVIPLYNDKQNIMNAINSALSADYPKSKLEVVVADDCSRDGSYELVKAFASKNKRVKVVRTPKNSGAAAAKNVGIKNAKGEIVITMDSDSVMDKNAVREFVAHFEDKRVGGMSGAVRVKNKEKLIEKLQDYEYDITLFFRKALQAIDAIPVTPGGMSAFRKDAIMEVGLFDEKSLTEDQEIAYNLQKHNYKIKSSLKAVAYTVVPSNLKDLIKQRVRWIRGGIYNRIKHKELLNPKYGDFVLFGFIYDFLFALPVALFVISQIAKMLSPAHWMERIGIANTILLSLNEFTFASLLLILMALPFSIHAVNTVREKVGDKKISWGELPYFLIYATLYSFVWVIAWIGVFYKALKREKLRWETR